MGWFKSGFIAVVSWRISLLLLMTFLEPALLYARDWCDDERSW